MQDATGMWLARFLGSLGGAAVCLAIMKPKTRAEALQYTIVSVVFGTFFGEQSLALLEPRIGMAFGIGLERQVQGAILAGTFAWVILVLVFKYVGNSKSPTQLGKGK